MKESYGNVKLLFGKIKYEEFKWKLYSDLNVVALLLGMQVRVHKILLLLVRVGQPGQEESLCK